jgi:formylglycine-generating enzyme required for sulfatase activity
MVRVLGRVLTATFGVIAILTALQAGAGAKLSSVTGKLISIPLGARDGIVAGLKGKVMADDGQSKQVPIAFFVVTNVDDKACQAELTEVGTGFEVAAGMGVVFDKALIPPSKEARQSPVASKSPHATPETQRGPLFYLTKGDEEFQAGRFDRAESNYKKVLEIKPDDMVAQRGLAEVEARRKELADEEAKAKAKEEKKKVLGEEKFQSAEYNLAAGDRAFKEGRKQEAAEYWKQVQAIDPDYPDLNVRLASLGPTPGEKRRFPPSNEEFVFLSGGTFPMGCVPGDHDCSTLEVPRHQVTISKGFWVAVRLVTVASYRTFAQQTRRDMPPPPSFPQGNDHPVVNVTWDDAAEYCKWAGGRLPSEAEWEYAARGGNTGLKFPWGNEITHDQANGAGTGGKDIWERTSPVGSFAPNAYGLFDIVGNVAEFVRDWFDPLYYSRSNTVDPQGPESGSLKVLRGGSWLNKIESMRVSNRNRDLPSTRSVDYGFRCVRDQVQ